MMNDGVIWRNNIKIQWRACNGLANNRRKRGQCLEKAMSCILISSWIQPEAEVAFKYEAATVSASVISMSNSDHSAMEQVQAHRIFCRQS